MMIQRIAVAFALLYAHFGLTVNAICGTLNDSRAAPDLADLKPITLNWDQAAKGLKAHNGGIAIYNACLPDNNRKSDVELGNSQRRAHTP